MSKFEGEPLVQELIDTYNELYLTSGVVEGAERYLGKSAWDAETVAERANQIIEEIGGANEDERLEHLTAMRADLEVALPLLIEYQRSEAYQRKRLCCAS